MHGLPAEEWPFVEWSLDYCLRKIQFAFNDFFQNFPNRWISFLMKKILFPWGNCYYPPKDSTAFQVAQLMQSNRKVRDRLTQYCYIGSETEQLASMEKTFIVWENIKPLWKKFQKLPVTIYSPDLSKRIISAYHAGYLSEQERDELSEFAEHYINFLSVDEFPRK